MSVRKTRAAAGGLVLGTLLGLTIAPDAQAAPLRPGVPNTLRISSGPYAGFEFCGAAPVATASGPALAATPSAPGGGYSPPGTSYPSLGAVFEIARPAQAAFIRRNVPPFNGFSLQYQAPAGALPDGAYRWRLRAVDGAMASAWSPWCDFTVRAASG